jgi:hypothetical protein
MAEASTQSPFSRTLTPEPDVLDGLWFEPDPADETAGDLTLPAANLATEAGSGAAPVADRERLPAFGAEATMPRLWTAKGRGGIGAAAAGVLGGLALMLFITHGRSAHRVGSLQPATATDRAAEPSATAPATPPAATSPSASPVKEPTAVPEPTAATPSTATEPAQDPAATKERLAAKAPALVQEPAPLKQPAALKEHAAVKEAVAVKASVAVKAPAAVKARLVMDSLAKTPASPTALRSPKTERNERAPASKASPTATGATGATGASGSVARDTGEKPRARTSPEVRLHNGVPLLD